MTQLSVTVVVGLLGGQHLAGQGIVVVSSNMQRGTMQSVGVPAQGGDTVEVDVGQ